MTPPTILDLFCGAGGAAMGYARAGLQVIGVDINPQPRYPFRFIQADAMEFLTSLSAGCELAGYEIRAIHASPPCQAYSSMKHRTRGEYTDLVGPTRDLLVASGLPYVIENVEGAPLRDPLTLCGSEFGLRSGERWLRRHRLFESNVDLMGAGGCNCAGRPIGGVYGNGGAGQQTRGWRFHPAEAREAMGIDWMSRPELSQAIPPVYTQHVGEQLLTHITAAVAS